MTAAQGVIAGSESAAREAAAWAAVRADSSIQFAPVPPPKPPTTPDWLISLGKFFEKLLRPLGELFGFDWRWLMWVLIGLAAAGALWLLWELVLRPLIARRRGAGAGQPDDWTPGHDEALALLEDADRLAAAGRFGEAAHLLLQRSVGQIALARPGWLAPASTAREIGAHTALPQRARDAFAAIAGVVEGSRYALREAGQGDWQRARSAYTDFALADLRGSAA